MTNPIANDTVAGGARCAPSAFFHPVFPPPVTPMHKQREFDFARSAKLNLLENLDLPKPPPPLAGQKGTSKAAMCSLLKAIDCKARDHARFTISWDQLSIITQMGKNTVRRAAAGLVALDLLIMHTRKHCGWQSYGFQIAWSNLFDHRRVAPPPKVDPFFVGLQRVPTREDRVPTGEDRVPPGGTPLNRPSSAQITQGRTRPGGGEFSTTIRPPAEATDDDRADAEKYCQRVGRCIGTREPEDIELACKVGWLVGLGAISQHAVHDAIGGVQQMRPDNPAAYFQTCLRNTLAAEGEALNDLLAQIPYSAQPRRRTHL